MTSIHLTPSEKKMLKRIVRVAPLTETALTASGGRAYTTLRNLANKGLVKRIDHPSVIDRRTGWPAEAYEPTSLGRSTME